MVFPASMGTWGTLMVLLPCEDAISDDTLTKATGSDRD